MLEEIVMTVQYEIKAFDEANGSIVVRYFTEEYPKGLTYNIDLPINNGAYPSQAEIYDLIEHFKPVGQLQRAIAVKSAEVPFYLSALNDQLVLDQPPEQ